MTTIASTALRDCGTMRSRRWLAIAAVVASAAGSGTGCTAEEVMTSDDARSAYLGLDQSVDRALNLGLAGYNEAESANIPPQQAPGNEAGTLTVAGQVDQGSSANKQMRLEVALDSYFDGPVLQTLALFYDTVDPLELDVSLKNLPNGSLTGSLVGEVELTGDLEGTVMLDLTMIGSTEDDPDAPGQIRREAGTTRIWGTATSEFGTHEVDVIR